MMPAIIIAELLALWLLSRRLSQNLYIAAFLLTKSRPIAIGFLSLLFFPGTVIHELAHLFTAEILGVRTSGLTLVPEGLEEKNVKTGSVAIAQSDPIRRAIIGIAPIFVGLGTLGLLSYFLPSIWTQTQIDATQGVLFSSPSLYYMLLTIYSLFAVSNTMFSSPEDMEGFWPVVVVIALVMGAAYIVGIRINLTASTNTAITLFLQSMAINIGYVTALNIGLFGLSTLLIRGVEKITRRTLVRPQ
jgi:hypothetical protein